MPSLATRRRPAISAALAAAGLAASVLLTGCGADTSSAAEAPASAGPTASDSASPKASPSASDEPERTGTEKGDPKAAEEAAKERAAAAPDGDPAPARRTDVPKPGDYGFGAKAASGGGGDVVVYRPQQQKDGLKVPVTVTNSGKERAFYKVRVKVTGDGGFSSTVTLSTEVTGVSPGNTWPTELTAKDASGRPAPKEADVKIVKVDRKAMDRNSGY